MTIQRLASVLSIKLRIRGRLYLLTKIIVRKRSDSKTRSESSSASYVALVLENQRDRCQIVRIALRGYLDGINKLLHRVLL